MQLRSALPFMHGFSPKKDHFIEEASSKIRKKHLKNNISTLSHYRVLTLIIIF